MATYTTNLDLLKKDVVTDGNETFNIETMLNDNWQKIDDAFGLPVYGNEIHGLRINENKNIEYYNVDDAEWVEVKSGSDGAPLQAKHYKIPATKDGQTDFEIPLTTFDPTIDVMLVVQNRTVLEPDEYTLKQSGLKHYVSLVEPVKDFANTAISLMIFKGKIIVGEIKDIPQASTTTVGIVGLTNDLGVSESVAVTQKALNDVATVKADKTAVESLEQSKANKSDIPVLNNTVTSESATEAATANAVKTAYDRAEQAFQSASNGKTVIANAVTGKGVPTSASDTFQQMATNISSIKVGKYDSGDIVTDAKMVIDTTKGRGKESYLTQTLYFTRMALDNARNVIYGCGTKGDGYLSKNSKDTGGAIWTLTDGITNVNKCVVGSNGNIYLSRSASTNNFLIINPNGGMVKQITTSSNNNALGIDKFDNIYIGGYNGTNYTLQKHTTDGTKVWEKVVAGQIQNIDCDEQGNIYCGMVTGTGSIGKFNQDGVQQWGVLNAVVIDVKVAPNGNIGICEGSYTRILEPTKGATVISFDSSQVTSLAFDSGSYVYTSYKVNYPTILRHDSRKGAMLLEHDRLKSVYTASHIVIDDEDNVFVSLHKNSNEPRLMKVNMLTYYTIL